MKAYKTTNWQAKIVLGAVTIAISALLLEGLANRFVYPSAEAVEARRTVIAAQAQYLDRARALVGGEVKAAQAPAAPRI